MLLMCFTVAAAFPLYFMIVSAFKTRPEYLVNPLGPPHHWVLSTLSAAFHGGALVDWLLNSVIVTVGSVGVTTVVAALGAYALALMRWRIAGAVTAGLIALMVIPPIVLVVPLFQLVVNLHQIYTFRAAIVIYAGLMLPFSTFLLASYFATIPRSLIEAARIDGAGHLRILRSVVLPLSMPALVTDAVVQALWVWGELLIAILFLQPNNLRTLMVGITTYTSRYRFDVPSTMAALLLATVPMVALFVAGQRFFVRGLTAGGVKG
jgi:ABC-type glycerol-3-phosphate transport system permease component